MGYNWQVARKQCFTQKKTQMVKIIHKIVKAVFYELILISRSSVPGFKHLFVWKSQDQHGAVALNLSIYIDLSS